MNSTIEQLLVNKVKNFSKDAADKFHNNLVRHHTEGMYCWETTNTGVFIWRDIGAHFISNAGEVTKITKWYSPNDWFLHQEFYNISLKTNKFRVEIPVESKIIHIDNKPHFYSKVQRPNYELGEDFQLDLFTGKVNLEYFIEFINTSIEPLVALKELDNTYHMGVPAVRFPVSRRIRDSKGYFWADFKQWCIPFTEFINTQFVDLDFVLAILETNFGFDTQDSITIKKYAEKIWRSI